MKYPIGMQSFDQIITGGFVYVDKTDMVYSLVKEGKIYFLSRPRRFGKSLLVSTLKNYFLGRKELFKGLKIEALEKDWDVYPVFHIDFGCANIGEERWLERKLEYFLSQYEKEYGVVPDHDYGSLTGVRFVHLLENIHKVTGKRVVVLVDDYDRPLLDVLGYGEEMEMKCLRTLNAFYSAFKAADEHLHFLFLTGTTNICQVRIDSGMNQFHDITMHWKYATICGITHEELGETFREPIEDMAIEYKCSYDEMMEKLRKQYGGYHFSDDMTDMYNPYSVYNAFFHRYLYNNEIWNAVPSSLLRLMVQSDKTVNDFAGLRFSPMEFVHSMASAKSPLPMLYNSGCLSIKEYYKKRECYILDFPNDEVRKWSVTLADKRSLL